MSGKKEIVSFENIRRISKDTTATIHFIGIGGSSMYSLARLAMVCGAKVSGSDREASNRTDAIAKQGARVTIGHLAENVHGATLVVYTHAISQDNEELIEAKRLGIPTVSRAEYMGAMMLTYSQRIGVSGSHGKSTTVAMLDCIFSRTTCEPTVLSGAELTEGEPLKIGSDNLMIYEACEYQDSFLKFSPTISVGLNLELDHTDYFESIEAIRLTFAKALSRATKLSVLSGDDENLRKIIKKIKCPVVTFGSGENNDYRYFVTSFQSGGFEFSLSKHGSKIASFELKIPGVFNVHNATAAIVTALEYGIDVNTIAEAIKGYRGIPRRLEFIGMRHGRQVYYDYAHHPTEIAASINALKLLTHESITVVFRPHTFSRTKSLWNELSGALSLADYLILTDIYPAREEPVLGITSEALAGYIGQGARYCRDYDVIKILDRYTQGVIVLMGAGDLGKIKKEIINSY